MLEMMQARGAEGDGHALFADGTGRRAGQDRGGTGYGRTTTNGECLHEKLEQRYLIGAIRVIINKGR